MNQEKLKEVFKDKAFVESLFSLKTPQEAQAVLAEKGVEIEVEELVELNQFILKMKKGEISQEQLESIQQMAESGELNEETLENVTGGAWQLVLGAIGVALLVGVLITGEIQEWW